MSENKMQLEHEHTVDAIRERILSVRHSYVRDWIYGGIDGTITTFAIVSGVAGAQLSAVVVIILGFANLLADGFSMAASNYLGTQAEHDDYEYLEEVERRHIELEPEGEREEIRQIYIAKGFTGEDLEKAVELITSDKDRWVQTMLREEYDLPSEIRSPSKAAVSTFSAFFICGLVPLVPYLLKSNDSFLYSTVATGIVFFAIGAIKSYWSKTSWFRSGAETFLIGALAASLAYIVGALLRDLTV
jgi:VIT1/CCC1 family predicted Fe2+/Mn2+ transporter